ncbi:MAG: dihydrodipicolinate synthase family protein [Gemmatimonadales bacterium]|nr:dihydrodipicolinate synthase family protein [Gemmatimonadales bacterium]NIN13321.1 dihydrodipicolinate synthase family protein [Gemmatimonadales bacterium]NIN51324.1 dihydrodipicolinate synthase family protein [Gemmatimonadales bacterium]NIP08788.1 dihydrodipicolinate synthase family protein [Gemmatimonadales bacterium]NIQ99782.1 dihydrodipicolinate synthase family protein [Gemmatimonadales bacterium]
MASDLATRLWHRVIPAVPVPFSTSGELDDDALRAYVAWMAGQDIGAVAVWAHTGRGLHLDDEGRARVLDAWRAGLTDVPIICGVGVPSSATLSSDTTRLTSAVIDATVGMAQAAGEGGAAGVLVYPPTALRDLPDSDQRVVELHQAVAAVGLPAVAFYLYDAAGGVAYSPQAIERILALDGVIGIKVATLDSVMCYQELVPVVRNSAGALLFTGEDRFLGYSLMLGADAALVGIAAACTDVSAALLAAWQQRDVQRFLLLSAQLDAFGLATFAPPVDGYVQRMLWALETDGVIGREARDPFGPGLSRGERDKVARAVRALRDL